LIAVIVASGPSASSVNLEAIRGRAFVVAVNESWRLCPWADALYACDPEWWEDRGPSEADFPGWRWSNGWRSGFSHNSGEQAIRRAVSEGAKHVILVGFDFKGEHWHGPHGGRLNNPTDKLLAAWAGELDDFAPVLAALGVTVIDTSPDGALTAFPKLSLDEALAKLEGHP
jgi:hypothetical protein